MMMTIGMLTIRKYNGNSSIVTIPETLGGSTIEAIDVCAFKDHTEIETLNIGSNIKMIDIEAFYGCNFTEINFSNDCMIKTFPELTNMTKLKNVNFPKYVETIVKYGFKNCTSLKHITIPVEVVTIGDEAFEGCSSLKEVVFKNADINPSGFGENIFRYCSSELTLYCYWDSNVPWYGNKNGIKVKRIDDIEDYDVLGIKDVYYTGKEITFDLKIMQRDKVLKEDYDYTLEYFDNKEVGKATIKIEGKKSFEGTSNWVYFNIKGKLSDATIYALNGEYTGKEVLPDILVMYKDNYLVEGRDYTLSYKNNIKPGKATVTITGKELYVGKVSKNFVIKPQKATVKSVKNSSTKAAKITWNKDTTVTGYEVYVSERVVDNNYMKTTASSLNIRKSASTKSKIVDSVPEGTKLRILKRNVKKEGGYYWYKVELEGHGDFAGYEGYVRTKYLTKVYKAKKYNKVKTVTSNKTTSYTAKKLTKGKTYYARVRSYKTIDGKKVYGSYSSAKTVTIKK